MSRYLGLKKSYEDIKKRAATKDEKRLLCALSIISGAYDSVYLDLAEVKKECNKRYYPNFSREMFQAKFENKMSMLWKIPKEERYFAERYIELTTLEGQLFYISKCVRKGIGMEITERQLAATKNMIDGHKEPRHEYVSGSKKMKKRGDK